MFHSILVEKNISQSPRVQGILEKFKDTPVFEIDQYENWWAKIQKPYLDKREKLNLILAEKRGELVKAAPPAYGVAGEPHYYFVHAYNCIYECQYCYLQGHFRSPDLVLFLNHDEITAEMEQVLLQHEGPVWFHAGEFSDSLALTHLTQELPVYWKFIENHSQANLELRTKSVNTQELLKMIPHPRVYTSFSLSPERAAKELDLRTPGTSLRIKAMQKLIEKGFRVAAHFDPIVFHADYEREYTELISQLADAGVLQKLEYLTLGVVRFSKQSYEIFENNYPDSSILRTPLKKESGDKVKYKKELREKILSTIEKVLIQKGLPQPRIYWCME